MKIALQLYSIKEDTAKNFIGALEDVAKMGYDGVEFAGYGGISASEMKTHLEKLNLKAVSSHVSLDALRSNLEDEINYLKEIGGQYIVCPYAAIENEEELNGLITEFAEIGKKVREAGLTFAYHNHNQEFQIFGGQYGLDRIFGEIPPEDIVTEIDTYWVKFSGVDPVEYVKKYSGRIPILHLKDLNTDAEGVDKKSVDLGTGVVPIKELVEMGLNNGTEWFIVEQEHHEISTMQSVKNGIEYLRSL